MTEREKFKIAETKERLFAKYPKCRNCGESIYKHGTPQLAHIIPATKANLRKYGEGIVHHDLNLAPVCSLKCNSAMLIGNSTIRIVEQLYLISSSITDVKHFTEKVSRREAACDDWCCEKYPE